MTEEQKEEWRALLRDIGFVPVTTDGWPSETWFFERSCVWARFDSPDVNRFAIDLSQVTRAEFFSWLFAKYYEDIQLMHDPVED